ncbi:MAG: hypothetical protein ACRD2H_16660, partial [Terriglobales bacterium]
MKAVWIEHESWITSFFVRHMTHCLLCDKRLEVLPSLGSWAMSSVGEWSVGSSLRQAAEKPMQDH